MAQEGAHAAASKPPLDMSMTTGRTIAVPGSVPAIPWPSTGQSAVAVPGAGLLEESGPETPLPIASLTKMMTAYLTLHQHPLTATSPGPDITLTEADQQEYAEDTVQDASSVEVQAGEVLTERQLLSGMIVRSANNMADTARPLGRREHPRVRRKDERRGGVARDDLHALHRYERSRRRHRLDCIGPVAPGQTGARASLVRVDRRSAEGHPTGSRNHLQLRDRSRDRRCHRHQVRIHRGRHGVRGARGSSGALQDRQRHHPCRRSRAARWSGLRRSRGHRDDQRGLHRVFDL